MNRQRFTAEQLIALILAGTVSSVLLLSAASMAFYGPDAVKPEGREAMQAILALMVGILSGYLLRARDNNKPGP